MWPGGEARPGAEGRHVMCSGLGDSIVKGSQLKQSTQQTKVTKPLKKRKCCSTTNVCALENLSACYLGSGPVGDEWVWSLSHDHHVSDHVT